MAAYAALVSVMHIIDQIQHHPRPPISLDKKQVDSLIEKVNFLQDYLEGYSHGGDSKEADGLESRIADAAYAAEDIIESHIVDQILAESTSQGEKISSINFYQGLERVIEDMDSIKTEVMEVKEKLKGVQDQPNRSSSISAASLRSPSSVQNRTMVGFDDVLYKILDKLAGGQPHRQIIPIVGMGGIGKTTLARNIYKHKIVVEHFDILAWVTISQEYQTREILLEILQERGENLSQMNEYELGDKLHKRLSGRRYLIIMDDIWSIKVWDQLKLFFPDNNNGSRIMLTTRLSKLALQVAGSHGIDLGFLDEDNSWNLFCKNVFGEEDCPPELKEIGMEIVKNCKGLPLSIVVIGGLLAKSEQTQQYWEHIAENLNSIVNLEDNECCLQILYMSYNSLPVYLKPCFLYMGVYSEDQEIRASVLIKRWLAEGFLKPICGKSLEEVAKEYLKELSDRNLILVDEWSIRGKIKYCKIHDLLRDLCLREAQKQKFLCVRREQSFNIPQGINTERRICYNGGSLKECPPQVLQALESASLARSLIWESDEKPLLSFSFRLLRVYEQVESSYDDGESQEYSALLDRIFQQVNLRYLIFDFQDDHLDPLLRIPSSISLLWNLQTLIVLGTLELTIALPLLRHALLYGLEFQDPPSGHMDGQDDIVLESLQTLFVVNFKCGEEMVKRIPNIKKLKLFYDEFYCLNNLGHLRKLESFGLFCDCDPENMRSHLGQNLTFPHFLKKLTLQGTELHWEELTTKIGSLPLLEVLKLKENSFIGPHWETVEGQFCSLIFLLIDDCDDLESWTTESTHFLRLEHLVLKHLDKLKEIPSSIGDIPTLQSIQLKYCSGSAVDSAKRIQEEQEEIGNVGLKVQVTLHREYYIGRLILPKMSKLIRDDSQVLKR